MDPVNAKAKGTRAELRCIKDLEGQGYLCTRAGASLGLFDVIAMHPTGAVARFIQVKSGTSRLTRKDRVELENNAPLAPNIFVEYWHWDRGWTHRGVYSPAMKQWHPLT